MSDQPNLLPEGTLIEHNGQPLKIANRVASGLTGEVYRGELGNLDGSDIPVAIKAMRPLEFSAARQFFERESHVLPALQHLEGEANREEGLDFYVSPSFYGLGEYGGVPYIVMEFIQGEKVPKLLEQSPSRSFPELQSLIIAWQLFRTLGIMHEKIKKTYIDLKFENLWWIPGAQKQSGQLKLTDFGTLEDLKPTDTQQRGIKRDILLAGVYLCGMLTGEMAAYSLGRLLEPAEPILKRHKDQISWGTNALLRRLLHHNPAARPARASDIAMELRTLVSYWQKSEEELFTLAEKNIGRAESDPQSSKSRDLAVRARAALDIIQRKPPFDSVRLEIALGRVDAILQQSDYIERGIALFKGRSYGMARKIFEEGIDWSDEPDHIRRWTYLALAGEQIDAEIFDVNREDAMLAIDRLNESNAEAAQNRLVNLEAKGLVCTGVDGLKSEVHLLLAEEAQARQEYQAAAAQYREALRLLDQDALKKLAFVPKKIVEVDSLKSASEDAAAGVGKAQAQLNLIAESLQSGDIDKVLSYASDAVMADPNNEEAQRAVRAAAHLYNARMFLSRSKRQEFLQSIDSLGFDQKYAASAGPTILNLLTSAQSCVDLNLAGLSDAYFLKELAIRFESPFIQQPDRASQLKAASQSITERELQKIWNVAQRLAARALLLDSLNNLADPDQAASLGGKVRLADMMIVRSQREQEILKLIQLARPMAQFVQKTAELEALLPKKPVHAEEPLIPTGIMSFEENQAGADNSEWKQQLRDLVQNIIDGEKRIDELRRLHSGGDVLRSLSREQETLLKSLMGACYSLLAIGKANMAQVQEAWEWAVKRLENSPRNPAVLLEEARSDFYNGEEATAAAQMDWLELVIGDRPEWLRFHQEILLVRSWKNWQEKNKGILTSGEPNKEIMIAIGRFLNSNIPPIYWKNSLVPEYLQRARARSYELLWNHIGSPQPQELLTKYSLYLRISKMMDRSKAKIEDSFHSTRSE